MPTTIDVTENNTSEFNLSSGEMQIARFDVENSGEYLVKASNTSEAIRLCNTDNGNTYYLNSSNNWETVIDFGSGYNYYEISFEYGYAGWFYLGLSAYEPFAENATTIMGTSDITSNNSRYVSVSASDVEWFEFVAPSDGDYTFGLESYASAYIVAYTSETDSGSEYRYDHNKYLYKGEAYYIKVKGMNSWTDDTYFYVSGTGLTANSAYSLYSTNNIHLEAGYYVWFVFEDYDDAYNCYVYVNGNETTSTTVYNEYGSYYTSNSGSYDYSTDIYANGRFYVCVYAEYYDADITVTLYRN